MNKPRDREKARAYNKAYRASHCAERKAYQQAYRSTNRIEMVARYHAKKATEIAARAQGAA